MVFSGRKIPVMLNANGGDDGFLKGPLGCNAATGVYLHAMHKKRFIETMKDDDYEAFIGGDDVKVSLTKKENNSILQVLFRLSDETCIPGEELNDAEYGKKGARFTVGYVRDDGLVFDFLLNEMDLQNVVHEYLLEFWDKFYGLKADDQEFVKKLLEKHWECNPGQKPKAQPANQSKTNGSQTQASTATVGNIDIQSNDINGDLRIGDVLSVRPDGLMKLFSDLKNEQKTDAAIDGPKNLILGRFHRIIGSISSVITGKSSTKEGIVRTFLEFEGYAPEAIDALFGKVSHTTSTDNTKGTKDGKEGKTDDSKGSGSEKQVKLFHKKYERARGFAANSAATGGQKFPFEAIQAALNVAWDYALSPDTPREAADKYTEIAHMLQVEMDKVREQNGTDAGLGIMSSKLNAELDKIQAFQFYYAVGEEESFEFYFQDEPNA